MPDRGMIFMIAQELRRVELTYAPLAVEALKDDEFLDGMIIKSNAHDATHSSHGRDFRTLGFFLSSVLKEMKDGRVRIFDIGRGPNGYEVSVHLFPNAGEDNGTCYIDIIAHRHHMRRGKMVNDIRGQDVSDWRETISHQRHNTR